MDFPLLLLPDGPRSVRLVEALREAILSGRLPAGARLPASRQLAAQYGLSRGTVVAAYEELIGEGYCVARVGAGTFVKELRKTECGLRGGMGLGPTSAGSPSARQTSARPSGAAIRIPHSALESSLLSRWGSRLTRNIPQAAGAADVRFDFRSGVAPDALPAARLARALRDAALCLDVHHGPGEPAGSPRLRRALTGYLARARGLRADPSQIIVVNGSQQGIDLAARLLLDPGDRVCLEEPGYPRARAIFQALGGDLVPVPVDGSGLITQRMPDGGGRLVYVTPSHQYPTGAVLSAERRLALLRWAEAQGAWVLEDDYDSEFRYGGPPLPCLQGLDRAGRCLYLGSLSKLLHPALRIGYLVVPPALAPAAVAAKSMLDQATTPVIQEALAALFESGEIERHLRRATRAYRARRARLLAACAAHLPPDVRVWPVTGGLHAFVTVPGMEPARLLEEARRGGVGFGDAGECFLEAPPGAALTLWFSRIAPDRIEPGIRALAAAIRAARDRRRDGAVGSPGTRSS